MGKGGFLQRASPISTKFVGVLVAAGVCIPLARNDQVNNNIKEP